MKNVAAMVFVVLPLLAGGILLQVYLSKRESRWPGLIFPAITFLYSIVMVFSIAAYNGMAGGEVLMLIASVFFVSNIPTIVLLGIYLGCREKRNIRAQLDKMNIQDLD